MSPECRGKLFLEAYQVSAENEFDRRDVQRKSFLWGASLRAGTYEYNCKVFDFSLNGAGVRMEEKIAEGEEVKLVIPHVGAIKGKITWVKGERTGITFTDDADQIKFLLGSKIKLLGLE